MVSLPYAGVKTEIKIDKFISFNVVCLTMSHFRLFLGIPASVTIIAVDFLDFRENETLSFIMLFLGIVVFTYSIADSKNS